MAYLGGIIRTLKNELVQMNEANILRVMRQKDGSIGVGDERVLVGQEMLGGKEVSVSGKMKILLLKIADGTIEPGYVRKNMELLREINSDKQNLSKAVTDNIMAMKSCEDVVGALLGKKVHGLATEIPSVSDEERSTKDGLEHFYERVRDACRKVFKKDGYRGLLDKLDACHYIEKIYDHNHVVIAKVTSHEGAVGVGAFGASWCTCVAGANSKNMYDHYKDYDMRIVFVDRGDDYYSIWQLSENRGSWCMNANDEPDEKNLLAAIAEASGGDNAVRDIIDAIDNDILSKWLDEEFGMSEEGIKIDIDYDRKEVDGYCIVTRKRIVNGYSLLDETYNFCKDGFREVSEAEFLLPEWVDRIENPKDGFIKVEKDEKRDMFDKYEKWNIFDLETKKLVLPEWVSWIHDPKDGFVEVEKNEEGRNLFDLETKKFVFSGWVDLIVGPKDGFVKVEKNGKWNLFDLNMKEFALPEWFTTVGLGGNGFAQVEKDGKYKLFNLRKKEFVFPEWVDGIYRLGDGFVSDRKDKKTNLFDMKTNKFVLPEWFEHVEESKNGFVEVQRDGEWNLFDMNKKELVLPEWVEHVIYHGDGFVEIRKDEKHNLFDLKKNEFLLPEWVDFIYSPKDGFVRIFKDGKYNLFDLKKNEFLLPEWVSKIEPPKNGLVKVEKGWKQNLFDVETKKPVFPEWVGYISDPEDGFVGVGKNGKHNLFDLKTKKLVLPEWVDYIEDPGDGFVDIYKNGEHQKIKLSDLRKTESRRRCENRICECCGRRIR